MSTNDAVTRQVSTLSAAGAKAALAAAEEAARAGGVPLSVAVVDVAGELLAFSRMDGAPPTSVDAAIRKARTAAQFGAPSKFFEDLVAGGNNTILAFGAVCPAQGGVPVIVGGAVVGGIGGSGGSGDDDESAAKAGAAALA